MQPLPVLSGAPQTRGQGERMWPMAARMGAGWFSQRVALKGKLLTGTQTRFTYGPENKELKEPEYISVNHFTITLDTTRRSAGSSQARNICIVRKPGKIALNQSLMGIYTQRNMIHTLVGDSKGTGLDYIQTGKTGAYAKFTLKRVK